MSVELNTKVMYIILVSPSCTDQISEGYLTLLSKKTTLLLNPQTANPSQDFPIAVIINVFRRIR